MKAHVTICGEDGPLGVLIATRLIAVDPLEIIREGLYHDRLHQSAVLRLLDWTLEKRRVDGVEGNHHQHETMCILESVKVMMGGGVEIDGTIIVNRAVEVGLIIEQVLDEVGREREVEVEAREVKFMV